MSAGMRSRGWLCLPRSALSDSRPAPPAARKDGAGRGRLGSDTAVSPERLPGVITPPPLVPLSDLTLSTGPSTSLPRP